MKTSPQSAWQAPRHWSRSFEAYLGIGASTCPKPLMAHISAYLAPSFACMGLPRHCRPSLVQSSTQSVCMGSSFALGCHLFSSWTAWSTNLTASALSFAKGTLTVAMMMSASLPCKSDLSSVVTAAGAPFLSFPPPAAGGAASRRSGRSRARSGSGFSLVLHRPVTHATMFFRSCSPNRLSTISWSTSSTVNCPVWTPTLMFARAIFAAIG
mmetsp:Transcript_50775/g.164196  ORF Transcript_50775/g.164196 Transcript_50775/m.164196 type:complete len:211 (+) Transcript_50775:895-1527(+)